MSLTTRLRGALFFGVWLIAPALRGQEYVESFKRAQQAFDKGAYAAAVQAGESALNQAQGTTLTPKEDKARIAVFLGEAYCIQGEFGKWTQLANKYKEIAD